MLQLLQSRRICDLFPKLPPLISRVLVAIDAWFGRLVQSDKGLTPYLILRRFPQVFFRHERNAT
jgi:hypothetical protein